MARNLEDLPGTGVAGGKPMGKVKTALWAFSSFYEDFYTFLLTVFGRVACRIFTECSCAKSIFKD
ncbi:hypothetical protein Pfra02_37030 [Pseudomonas fragi]|nr:hypothetical protein Pfra02_37030 [Pseudomonas fragi]